MKHQTAKLVKKARELRGLKQSILASRLGVNVNTVAGWEQGRHSAHPEDLARIARILDLSIEYRPNTFGEWEWDVCPIEADDVSLVGAAGALGEAGMQ